MQSVSSIMPVVNISDKNSVPATCFKDVMPCEVSPLGFHLLLSVKENIWKREIVKVLSLCFLLLHSFLLGMIGNLKERKYVPRPFFNWLQAFLMLY